jgi:hypothetical protein
MNTPTMPVHQKGQEESCPMTHQATGLAISDNLTLTLAKTVAIRQIVDHS